MLLQIDCPNGDVIQKIVEAIGTLVPPDAIKVFKSMSLPIKTHDEVDPVLVQKIVGAIRPSASQIARKQFLRAVLRGGNSFFENQGEPDHEQRAASIGISRALRKLFPNHVSPLDSLIQRRRTYFADGTYKGIEYVPTPLSYKVFEVLRAEGSI